MTALHDGWTLRPLAGTGAGRVCGAGPVPATVPGCVHTDLLARRPDPRPVPRRQRATARAGSGAPTGATRRPSTGPPRPPPTSGSTWSSTAWTPSPRSTLNGAASARTANMHRGYRFDVRRRCCATATTTLAVDLRLARPTTPSRRASELGRPAARQPPPVQRDPQDGLQLRLGLGPGPGRPPASGGRSACSRWRHGTAGRGPAARRRSTGRPRHASTCTSTSSASTGSAPVRGRGHASAADGPTVAARRGRARRRAAARRARRRSCGGRAATASSRCYALERGAAGRGRPSWTRGGAGSASARCALDTAPDEHGTPFTFVVNGRPVFVKGVNWIPDDCFPHRIDRDALRGAARPGRRGRTSTCCGSGAAASTRATTSTRCATSSG